MHFTLFSTQLNNKEHVPVTLQQRLEGTVPGTDKMQVYKPEQPELRC